MRWSLRGLTEEGDEAWLIRGIARKLYRCPGCHGDIPVGDEHTVVQYVRRLGGTDHHHWHRRCAEELLVPELGNLKRVPAVGVEPVASSRRAGGARPVGGAALTVSLRRRLAALYARIWRTYWGWAPSLLPLAVDRLRPARPARRARRSNVDVDSLDLDSGIKVAALVARGRRWSPPPACSARSSSAARSRSRSPTPTTASRRRCARSPGGSTTGG